MAEHRTVRIEEVARFADAIEVVQATLEVTATGLGWHYDRDPLEIKEGDAIENPPVDARVGDVVALRIIRGYAKAVEMARAAPIDTRTPEELEEAGIEIEYDELGKRHITLKAEPHVTLRDGRPRWVTCSSLPDWVPFRDPPLPGVLLHVIAWLAKITPGCQMLRLFRGSGRTGWWIPPHAGVRKWTCPTCRHHLSPLRQHAP